MCSKIEECPVAEDIVNLSESDEESVMENIYEEPEEEILLEEIKGVEEKKEIEESRSLTDYL